MVTQLLNQIFGSKNDREIKALRPIVEQINSLESGLTPLSDQVLADKTQEFKKRLGAGETLDAILPEAFAVCREMSRRKLSMRALEGKGVNLVTVNDYLAKRDAQWMSVLYHAL